MIYSTVLFVTVMYTVLCKQYLVVLTKVGHLSCVPIIYITE